MKIIWAYQFYNNFLIFILGYLTVLARLKSSVRFLYVINMAQKKPTMLWNNTRN